MFFEAMDLDYDNVIRIPCIAEDRFPADQMGSVFADKWILQCWCSAGTGLLRR